MTQPTFRENPARTEMNYAGMTWLTVPDREIACVGVGEEVREAMLKLLEEGE